MTIKAYLRKVKLRNADALFDAIGLALDTITLLISKNGLYIVTIDYKKLDCYISPFYETAVIREMGAPSNC